MDLIYEKRRDVFFRNLLLLGFDLKRQEREHRTTFHRDMFAVQNKKAFEVVTHFLFDRLNDVCRGEFKIIWPLLDKNAIRDFRKTCFTYLTKISQDDIGGVQFPRFSQTMLMSPGGEKFYEVYLAFSTYVMQKHIDADKTVQRLFFPKVKTKKLQAVAKRSLKISAVISTHEFVETQKTSLQHQYEWEKTAEDFTAYYRHTKQKTCEQKACKKETLYLLHLRCCGDEVTIDDSQKLENAIKEKDKLFGKVLSMWTIVEEQLAQENVLWDVMRTVLDSEEMNKLVLDGHKYMAMNVPQIIKTKYIKDLQARKVRSLTENGKLSLKNFLHLWSISVKLYIESFKKANLPNPEGLASFLKKNLQRLEEYLNMAKALNQRLMEMLSDTANNIEALEEKSYPKDSNDQPAGFPPFTPPLTFTPKSRRNSSVTLDSFLFLTPNPCVKKMKTSPSVSPLCYKVLNSSSPGENCGHLEVNSRKIARSQMSESPTTDHDCVDVFSPIDNKTSEFRLMDVFSNLSLENMYDSRGLNDSDSSAATYSFISNSSVMCSSKLRDLGSIETGRHVDPLSGVKKKFIEQVVREFVDDHSEIDLSLGDSLGSQSLHESSFDCLGKFAFESRNTVHRTPEMVSCDFSVNSIKELAELNKHLHSVPKDVSALRETKDHNFFLSFSEEEMLDDMTMPSVPYF